MKSFNDQSTATNMEKAKRFLKAMSDDEDCEYFYDDGFPRHHNIQNDAAATLEVLESLEERAP